MVFLRGACQQLLNAVKTSAGPGRSVLSSAVADDAARCIRVNWSDGSTGSFAYAWLRDNAPAGHTYNFGGRNRARHLLMKELNPNVRPVSVEIVQDGAALGIHWDKSGNMDTTYPQNWLAKRNMGGPHFQREREVYHRGTNLNEHWDAEKGEQIIADPAVWDRLFTDPRYLRDQLLKFMTYGLLYIRGAPAKDGALNELNRCLGSGSLLNTHHGLASNPAVFQVYVEIDPCNLMNTPNALGLHTDLPQYQSPPEVQILHVVQQAGVGGESQFVDGLRVAHQLREEQPKVYETLCKYPIEYIDWGAFNDRFEFVAKWRTIEVNSAGEPQAVFFNNAVRSWYYEAAAEEIPAIYDALSVFNDYLYQPRNLLQLKMENGDMMVFSNNRVLHGRSAFQLDSQRPITRHLEGAFTNYQNLRSKIRCLNEDLNEVKHAAYEVN